MTDSCQRTWRIHIGAHKTGTTHVQDTLALRREMLARSGIDYPTRESLRRSRLASCVRPASGWIKDLPLLRRWRAAWALSRARTDRRLPTLLISEEQFIGLSDGLLGPVLYPDAADRMRHLRALAAGQPTTLFLTVRNPASIIPSAYSQCLRAGARGLPTVEAVRRRAVENPASWTDLVRRIHAGFPEAALVVWTFEDYIAHPGDYLDLLAGKPIGGWPELEAPASTRALSAEAIERILGLDAGLGRAERVAACARIAEQDNGSRRFQPFSPEEVSTLTRAYESDLAAMEREFPGVLRRLPPRSA